MRFSILLRKGVVGAILIFLTHMVCAGQSPHTEVRLPGGIMTYGQIFDQVEKQAKVWFGYNVQRLDINKEVVVPQGTYTIAGLLDWLFSSTEYKYTFTDKNILVYSQSESKPVSIEETYSKNNFEPLKATLPKVALKTNLIYDATTTINLGMEFGLAPKWTLDVPFNYNAWKFGNDMRLRHWGVQPEVRYWFCERFDGWFVGAHGHFAQFNVGVLPDWSFISQNMKDNRYEGYLYGGGISGGYSWILKNRWSMEATVGVGYAHIVYDKYPCGECGSSMGRKTKDYFGPTKVGLSLVFMIK